MEITLRNISLLNINQRLFPINIRRESVRLFDFIWCISSLSTDIFERAFIEFYLLGSSKRTLNDAILSADVDLLHLGQINLALNYLHVVNLTVEPIIVFIMGLYFG